MIIKSKLSQKKALKGFEVKSNQELEIANYLLLKGINFEYEEARDHGSRFLIQIFISLKRMIMIILYMMYI